MTKEQKKRFLQYLKNLKLIQADDFYREGLDMAISALSENKGEWIYDKGIYNWRCSRCGQTPPPTGYVGKVDFMETHFKFCPDCGADMREPKPKLGNSMLVGKPSLLNQIPIGEKGE